MVARSNAAASRNTLKVPGAARSYSTPVSCRNDDIARSEYRDNRKLLKLLRSKRGAREFLRKLIPHPARVGSALHRSCNGASERVSDLSKTRQQPGAFHGSGILGVSSAPFAKLVSNPGPSARSMTVTS
jgi:hypothetical protein